MTVSATDQWLYELILKASQRLSKSVQQESKAYFSLVSTIDMQPVELLECYYNATLTAAKVKQLRFKNGRAGAAQYGERYFMNLNSSQVFSSIDLLNGHPNMPAGPLQLSKRKLHKNYLLSLDHISDDTLPIYHLTFKPRYPDGTLFYGEIWIEKDSYVIKKIKMAVGPTQTHPFLPLFPNGKVLSVAMQVTKVFSDNNIPEHLDFNYTIHYQHLQTAAIVNSNKDTVFDVDCKGLLYFYDYKHPFIQPYFDYDESLDDYRKITLLSHNETFWPINSSNPYSLSMLEALAYFNAHGELINFQKKGKSFSSERQKLFETNFIAWSSTKRISLKNTRHTDDTKPQIGLAMESHNVERYNLKAQIFMDLNETKDSLQHCTIALLDTYKTFYNLPEEDVTNCFFNIFFDIYEIYRRALEKKLSDRSLTPEQAADLYQETITQLAATAEKYLVEVERGKRKEPFEKWNLYVVEKLGIDNMKLFNLSASQLQKGPEPLKFQSR